MFKRNPTIRLATMGCLILICTLSAAWALTILTQNLYSGSVVINKGEGSGLTLIRVVDDGLNQILLSIEPGSLDAYMDEQGVTQVEITGDLTEELVLGDDGLLYYRLSFHFGPHGTYFTPKPLILKLKGRYVSPNTQVWLFDENGEAVEGTRYNSADMIKFEIPHFSCYYYDGYY